MVNMVNISKSPQPKWWSCLASCLPFVRYARLAKLPSTKGSSCGCPDMLPASRNPPKPHELVQRAWLPVPPRPTLEHHTAFCCGALTPWYRAIPSGRTHLSRRTTKAACDVPSLCFRTFQAPHD